MQICILKPFYNFYHLPSWPSNAIFYNAQFFTQIFSSYFKFPIYLWYNLYSWCCFKPVHNFILILFAVFNSNRQCNLVILAASWVFLINLELFVLYSIMTLNDMCMSAHFLTILMAEMNLSSVQGYILLLSFINGWAHVTDWLQVDILNNYAKDNKYFKYICCVNHAFSRFFSFLHFGSKNHQGA